jgi:bifunctional enzyme CysN/CysC
MFPPTDFVEIWVNTTPEVCMQRDPKGLYKKASAGELPNMTGMGQDYETSASAEIIIDGSLELTKNVAIILETLKLAD